MKNFFFLVIALSLFGCSQIKEAIDRQHNPDPPPTEIPIKGISDGIEYRDNSSKNERRLPFSDVDQTYEIKPDEKVIISLDYNLADDEDLFIMSSYNKEKNIITIGLYDRFWDKQITLRSKCEVVEVRGLYDIPAISVDTGLAPEQIIITPLFDNQCNRYGFQIRYGSTGRGCGGVDKKVLEQFEKCTRPKRPKPTCYEQRWFGIPCP